MPHSRSDGIWDERQRLGAAWQLHALELCLHRYGALEPWWASRLELARYANLPVGLLPADAAPFAADMLLQRKLTQAGHLSWLSRSQMPDLGGFACAQPEEELAAPEVVLPGM